MLEAQEKVIREGVVVLAASIQANVLLFQPGPDDLPGELLICLEPEIDPRILAAVAGGIGPLKHKSWPDPARDTIAKYLTAETVRVFGLEVPAEMSRGHKLFCTTTIFRRRSLPDGVLKGRLFPVLVHPARFFAMILPHKHWTESGNALYLNS